MRRLLTISICALSLCCATKLNAETQTWRSEHPHELRFTVGDCLWETLIWHNEPHGYYAGLGTEQTVFDEKQHYNYTPHVALEYSYRVNRWLGIGLKADFQDTSWQLEHYNNRNQLLGTELQHFYNLSVVPTMRLTYLWHKRTSLYSALGVGLTVNGGSESDFEGQTTAFGAAAELTLLGLTAGKDNWNAVVELGGLSALKNTNTIFMLCSRAIAVGVSYTFMPKPVKK